MSKFQNKWLRRCISIPAVWLACSLMLALAPVWLLVAAIIDGSQSLRGNKTSYVRGLVFINFLLVMDVLGILATAAIKLTQASRSRESYLNANFRLQNWWGSTLWAGATKIFRLQLIVSGEDQLLPSPFILLPRHASIADVLLPTIAVAKPHNIRLRYVLKAELLWEPCLDIVGNRLPNVFVHRGSGDTRAELERLAEGVRGLGSHDGVMIYPEGTRFTPSKLKKVQTRLHEKLGANHISQKHQRTLPARPAGLAHLLETLPNVDLVFAAHSGMERIHRLNNLVNGQALDATFNLEFWRVAAATIPTDPSLRGEWIEQQWLQMDRRVSSMEAAQN